jgi:hypothetical protein
MTRYILLPHSLVLVYDQACMREHVWAMVCVRWGNLVVVGDYDNIFIANMVFSNWYVTLLGEKVCMCYNILVTAGNPCLHSWSSIHYNIFMHGSTFDIQHHVKVPKAVIC